MRPAAERPVVNASVHLVERMPRATVGLRTRIPDSHPSTAILGNERTGTGTVVDASGLILTVNYVVLGAEAVEATLLGGETCAGTVVAQDFSTGLALVKIEPPQKPAVAAPTRSSQQATIGQDVVIIASVGGADRRGNNGNITALNAFDAYWEYRLERAILTTAVNPGFGGAPLFDLSGHMIGVVSLDLGDVGRFTLAIPVEYYLEHRDELLRFGRCISRPSRAWVGFYCYSFREHVVIAGVFPGAPGEVAGLKAGDVVLAVNGERPADRGDLYARLWNHRSGETLTFRVFRDNEVKQIDVASGNAEEFFA